MAQLLDLSLFDKKSLSPLQSLVLEALTAQKAQVEKTSADALKVIQALKGFTGSCALLDDADKALAGLDMEAVWQEKCSKMVEEIGEFEAWRANRRFVSTTSNEDISKPKEAMAKYKLAQESVSAEYRARGADRDFDFVRAKILSEDLDNVLQNYWNPSTIVPEHNKDPVTSQTEPVKPVQLTRPEEDLKKSLLRNISLATQLNDAQKRLVSRNSIAKGFEEQLELKNSIICQLQNELAPLREEHRKQLDLWKPLFDVGVAIRKRKLQFYTKGRDSLKYSVDEAVIEKGVAAAEGGDWVADSAMFKLGLMTSAEDTRCLQDMYNTTEDPATANLLPSTIITKLINHTASLGDSYEGYMSGKDRKEYKEVHKKIMDQYVYYNKLFLTGKYPSIFKCHRAFDGDYEAANLMEKMDQFAERVLQSRKRSRLEALGYYGRDREYSMEEAEDLQELELKGLLGGDDAKTRDGGMSCSWDVGLDVKEGWCCPCHQEESS